MRQLARSQPWLASRILTASSLYLSTWPFTLRMWDRRESGCGEWTARESGNVRPAAPRLLSVSKVSLKGRREGELEGCPAGKWGFECSRLCHCEGDIPCDFTSGICSNGKCAKGFRGKDCDDDMDECSMGLADCSSEAECLNTRGAFECRCKAGFYGDGHNCTRSSLFFFGCVQE